MNIFISDLSGRSCSAKFFASLFLTAQLLVVFCRRKLSVEENTARKILEDTMKMATTWRQCFHSRDLALDIVLASRDLGWPKPHDELGIIGL